MSITGGIIMEGMSQPDASGDTQIGYNLGQPRLRCNFILIQMLIVLVLTLLGWIPGIIGAMVICARKES